jgi:SPRY domain-containing SOCS box protein 1/4
VIGVATSRTPLHCVGYQAIVGCDKDSWGWDLGRNKLYHDFTVKTGDIKACKSYPTPGFLHQNDLNDTSSSNNNEELYSLPDKFYMVLDCDEGTLSFIADRQFLGVAFQGLRGKAVSPMISAVWGHCEISLKYINGLQRKF